MKVTIGYAEQFGLGEPIEAEYEPGQPIHIEGSRLEISYRAGVLSVRGLDMSKPVVRAESSNAITVTAEDGPR